MHASSIAFAKTGAQVIACDFSLGMLKEGHKRSPQLIFSAGDALSLPFADETFDAVTISFGIRNVNNVDLALKEMFRVTKPGGRIVVCEFSSPTFEPFRNLYMEYLMKALPAIAKKTSSNPEAYIYLADSIRAWPNQKDFAAQIKNSNWSNVKWKNLTGGIVALHKAEKNKYYSPQYNYDYNEYLNDYNGNYYRNNYNYKGYNNYFGNKNYYKRYSNYSDNSNYKYPEHYYKQ